MRTYPTLRAALASVCIDVPYDFHRALDDSRTMPGGRTAYDRVLTYFSATCYWPLTNANHGLFKST